MAAPKLAKFGTNVAKGVGRLSTEIMESGSGSYVSKANGGMHVGKC
jgi:4-aminobutyrate aminotransferase